MRRYRLGAENKPLFCSSRAQKPRKTTSRSSRGGCPLVSSPREKESLPENRDAETATAVRRGSCTAAAPFDRLLARRALQFDAFAISRRTEQSPRSRQIRAARAARQAGGISQRECFLMAWHTRASTARQATRPSTSMEDLIRRVNNAIMQLAVPTQCPSRRAASPLFMKFQFASSVFDLRSFPRLGASVRNPTLFGRRRRAGGRARDRPRAGRASLVARVQGPRGSADGCVECRPPDAASLVAPASRGCTG